MKIRIPVGWGVMMGILVIMSIGLYFYIAYLGNWYERIQAEMPVIKGKLITLNNDTLSQIPPPDGVIMTQHEELGVNTDYDYGVVTSIGFRIENSDLDIQAYYRSTMERLGWRLNSSSNDPQSYDFRKYLSGETCFEITTYQTNKTVYRILVSHDFNKQNFSPKLPPMWYVKGIREYGKTNIITCP